MDYRRFKDRVRHLPVIPSALVMSGLENPQTLRNQMTYWRKRGLILKIRKGLYVLNEADRKVTPSKFYLANQILSPSYVSLESALAFYGILPESVVDTVSVTTKKTIQYDTPFGTFRYHHIQQPLFSGMKSVPDRNRMVTLIAQPEKALLDLMYFHQPELKKQGLDVWLESFRIQRDYPFRRGKMKELASSLGDREFRRFLSELIVLLRGNL